MSTAIASTQTSENLSTQKRLLQLRDKRLAERFNHFYKVKRLRYDDVMKKLEEEFFITERTIRGILKGAPDQPEEVVRPGDQMDLFKH